MPGYISDPTEAGIVSPSQKRVLDNYRLRLRIKGMSRFDVLGRDADRSMIRAVARKLAEDGPDAERLRVSLSRVIDADPSGKGGVLKAFRQSPLVGSGIIFERDQADRRDLEL